MAKNNIKPLFDPMAKIIQKTTNTKSAPTTVKVAPPAPARSIGSVGGGLGVGGAVMTPALAAYLSSLNGQANDVSGLNTDGSVDPSGGYDGGGYDAAAADAQALADAQAQATARVNAEYDQGSAAIDAAAKQLADRAAALNKSVGDTNQKLKDQYGTDMGAVNKDLGTATAGVPQGTPGVNIQPTMDAHTNNLNAFLSSLDAVSNREMADRQSNADIVTAGAKGALALAKFQAMQDIAAMTLGGSGGGGGGGSYGGSSRYGSGSGSDSGILSQGDAKVLGQLSAIQEQGKTYYRNQALGNLSPGVQKFVRQYAAKLKGKNPILNNIGPIATAIRASGHPNQAKQFKKDANAAKSAKQKAQTTVATNKAILKARGLL